MGDLGRPGISGRTIGRRLHTGPPEVTGGSGPVFASHLMSGLLLRRLLRFDGVFAWRGSLVLLPREVFLVPTPFEQETQFETQTLSADVIVSNS